MHIISFRIFREYPETHADCQEALSNWYKVARKAKWSNLVGVLDNAYLISLLCLMDS